MAVNELAGLRVMIAEDQLVQAMEMQWTLESHGCVVMGPAPSVAAALDLLREQRVDAAVLNYRLADGDASALIAALESRKVPFVVVTADPRVTVDAPLMTKPISEKELIEALLQALGQA